MAADQNEKLSTQQSHKNCSRERCAERTIPRQTFLLEKRSVETVVLIEDGHLIVLCSILIEERLAHEGEALGVPDVSGISTQKKDTGDTDTKVEKGRSA